MFLLSPPPSLVAPFMSATDPKNRFCQCLLVLPVLWCACVCCVDVTAVSCCCKSPCSVCVCGVDYWSPLLVSCALYCVHLCSVQCAWCLVLGAWCLALGAWRSAFGIRHSAFGIRCFCLVLSCPVCVMFVFCRRCLVIVFGISLFLVLSFLWCALVCRCFFCALGLVHVVKRAEHDLWATTGKLGRPISRNTVSLVTCYLFFNCVEVALATSCVVQVLCHISSNFCDAAVAAPTVTKN